MRGTGAAHDLDMTTTDTLYYCDGPLSDDQLIVSNSTEALLEAIIPDYSTSATAMAKGAIRYEFLLAAAMTTQEGLILAAVEAGTWDQETAPAWERDRLLASKRGRAPSAGSWDCVVPLVLIQRPGSARSRETRIRVTGNVLIIDGGTSPAHTLVSLNALGWIDTGRVQGTGRVKEPYL